MLKHPVSRHSCDLYLQMDVDEANLEIMTAPPLSSSGQLAMTACSELEAVEYKQDPIQNRNSHTIAVTL